MIRAQPHSNLETNSNDWDDRTGVSSGRRIIYAGDATVVSAISVPDLDGSTASLSVNSGNETADDLAWRQLAVLQERRAQEAAAMDGTPTATATAEAVAVAAVVQEDDCDCYEEELVDLDGNVSIRSGNNSSGYSSREGDCRSLGSRSQSSAQDIVMGQLAMLREHTQRKGPVSRLSPVPGSGHGPSPAGRTSPLESPRTSLSPHNSPPTATARPIRQFAAPRRTLSANGSCSRYSQQSGSVCDSSILSGDSSPNGSFCDNASGSVCDNSVQSGHSPSPRGGNSTRLVGRPAPRRSNSHDSAQGNINAIPLSARIPIRPNTNTNNHSTTHSSLSYNHHVRGYAADVSVISGSDRTDDPSFYTPSVAHSAGTAATPTSTTTPTARPVGMPSSPNSRSVMSRGEMEARYRQLQRQQQQLRQQQQQHQQVRNPQHQQSQQRGPTASMRQQQQMLIRQQQQQQIRQHQQLRQQQLQQQQQYSRDGASQRRYAPPSERDMYYDQAPSQRSARNGQNFPTARVVPEVVPEGRHGLGPRDPRDRDPRMMMQQRGMPPGVNPRYSGRPGPGGPDYRDAAYDRQGRPRGYSPPRSGGLPGRYGRPMPTNRARDMYSASGSGTNPPRRGDRMIGEGGMGGGGPNNSALDMMQQQQSSQGTTVEIMPGVEERLRTAKETWNAIQNDFYRPVTCFGCTFELLCISDASYVLCPDCRVVSPMEDGTTGVPSSIKNKNGGVGMGFKYDDLFRWQSEIVRERG